jgi:asparagine synthase (glutamine-hydrolysing)
MLRSRGMRYTTVGTAALARLADDAGAGIVHPLLDLRLWSAVAAAAPRSGFATTDDALAVTAGRALPGALVSRGTKASFDAVFFHDHSRRLAAQWTGAGMPEGLVDAAALRAHWLTSAPDAHSLTLMQAAWLAMAACAPRHERQRVSGRQP